MTVARYASLTARDRGRLKFSNDFKDRQCAAFSLPSYNDEPAHHQLDTP
jgi:hypothetical protein